MADEAKHDDDHEATVSMIVKATKGAATKQLESRTATMTLEAEFSSTSSEGGPTPPPRYSRKLTVDAPPDIDFYRTSADREDKDKRRPTIQELAANRLHSIDFGTKEFPLRQVVKERSGVKFGWVEGVFVRCLQNIIGVILYLRLTWVVGQAGIVLGLGIIILSSIVTVLTTLSTSTICTNGEMKGGGLYYLISRTLGAEFGGSIGIIFCLANCVGGALYIVGFAETINHLLGQNGVTIIDGAVWDVRLISVVTCVLLLTIICISATVESKLQQVLLIPLILSILSFVLGSFLWTEEKERHGYTGYQASTLLANMWPDFRNNHTFFTIFSVYFPAATGIMAGANISGNLRNPQIVTAVYRFSLHDATCYNALLSRPFFSTYRPMIIAELIQIWLFFYKVAIPRGTLSAIIVSTLIYTSFLIIAGATYLRDADGVIMPDVANAPDCYYNVTCPFGLINYYQACFVAIAVPTS